MTLASGQCRTKELEAAGSPVGLGVDGSASNDNSNLMESVRHALMLNRLTYDAASVTHFDAFRWATEGSARCLGRDDLGAIAVGKQADLAFYKLDELRFSGAGDPLAALVLCGAHTADRVMVRGVWQVEDGMPVGVDVGRLRHEHGKAARAFLARRVIEPAAHAAAACAPGGKHAIDYSLLPPATRRWRGGARRRGWPNRRIGRARRSRSLRSPLFDASRHVVIPGLDQYAPSFLPDADALAPGGDQQLALPLAGGALSDLGART